MHEDKEQHKDEESFVSDLPDLPIDTHHDTSSDQINEHPDVENSDDCSENVCVSSILRELGSRIIYV